VQRRDDRALGFPIHLGHEIVGRFLSHRDDVEITRRADDDVAGASGGFHRSVEHRMHGLIQDSEFRIRISAPHERDRSERKPRIVVCHAVAGIHVSATAVFV
jgi:hypothetical protein